jgi:hypothetical protein
MYCNFEERHRRRQDSGAFVLGLVEELARGRCDDRMDSRRVRRAEMIGGHHVAESRDERPLGIRKERGDARKGLLLLCVENVEDCSDQQRVRGFLPMVAPFERAFGIDQDIGDVLDVADLLDAAADLEQRVVPGRQRISRVEQKAVREARTPAGGPSNSRP